MLHPSLAFASAFVLFSLAPVAAAQELPARLAPEEEPPRVASVERARAAGVFTVYFENDYFGGTDRNYTNGVKLSWLSADLGGWGRSGWRKSFLQALPFVNRPDTAKNFGFSLGQQIYTPTDRKRTNPDPADRPYAGWTYLELSFVSKNAHRADIISIQAGMVGPSSLAEDTQRAVHEWINNDVPAGWDYQLRDEPGFNFIYERRYRLFYRTLSDSLGVDFIPHLGVSLGNVQTFANVGASVRLGLNLPSDFGVQIARGGAIGASPTDDLDPRVAVDRSVSLFVFAGAEGKAVARDIFLDGNTWKDSRSVDDKRRFVADLQVGVGVILGRWQLTGAFVHRTKEFKAQPDPFSRFGSITLSYVF